MLVCVSRSVVSDPLRPHRLQPDRLLCPWDSPRKNTEVSCHALLQGIFLNQVWNPTLLHCKQILYHLSHLSSVLLLSHVWLFATPWTATRQASLSISNSRSLPKLMSIKLAMPPGTSSSVVPFSSHLQSFPASGSFPISQFFTSGSQSIGVSASASNPSIEYSGLISFRIDWFNFLSIQGILNSLLQHHRSKVSILQHSAFFIVQL